MTLGEMIARTRGYLDDPRGVRFKRPEIIDWINAGQDDCKRIVEDLDESFFITCANFAVVAGTDLEFTLPTDFSRVIVLEDVSGTVPVALKSVPFHRRHATMDYVDPAYRYSSGDVFYIRGSKLGIPKPGSSYTARLTYSKVLPRLADEADVSEIPTDYHDLVCLNAAKVGYGVQSRDFPFPLEDRRRFYEKQMMNYLEGRQSGNDPQYVNVQY